MQNYFYKNKILELILIILTIALFWFDYKPLLLIIFISILIITIFLTLKLLGKIFGYELFALDHQGSILINKNLEENKTLELLIQAIKHQDKSFLNSIYANNFKIFNLKNKFYLVFISINLESIFSIKQLISNFDIPAFITTNEHIKDYNKSFKILFHPQLGEATNQTIDEYFLKALTKIANQSFIKFNDSLYNLVIINLNNIKLYLIVETNLENILDDFIKLPVFPTAILNYEKQIITCNSNFQSIVKSYQNIDNIINNNIWQKLQNFIKSDETHLEINFSPTSQYYCVNLFKIFNYKICANKILIVLKEETNTKINIDRQMAHSQKLQAVGQLAGGIAHDFNNLLTAMIGFCDLLLLKHPPGDKSFPEIMQIKQNANRAANLVRQLLAFSRKQTMNLAVIDITIIIDELASMISRLIGENVQLSIYHGRNLWLTKADAGQLEQVIVNLAVNARDAMNRNGKLKITTENIIINSLNDLGSDYIAPTEEDLILPGKYIKISFNDTGCGIVKHQIPKIFEPFYSTKEFGAGVGLGLATVYGIIKQIGGYIFVKSLIDQGTEFAIFLKHSNPEQDSKLIHINEVSKDLTGTETILLVEDEEAVRIFSAQALTNKGYNIYEATNGSEALEIIDKYEGKIDLIITDVMMPGINGPEMIQQMSQKFPHIKVIYTSGYGEDIFIEEFGEQRNFNFLAKPYNLKQLVEKVKEAL